MGCLAADMLIELKATELVKKKKAASNKWIIKVNVKDFGLFSGKLEHWTFFKDNLDSTLGMGGNTHYLSQDFIKDEENKDATNAYMHY